MLFLKIYVWLTWCLHLLQTFAQMPLLWVGFYLKQALRWCLACRMFIRECSWYQRVWKGGEGAEEEAKLWIWPSIRTTVSSGAKMACQSSPSLGWKRQSFFRVDLGWGKVSSGNPWRHCQQFPEARTTLLPWRGIWTSHGHFLNKFYPLLLLANWAPPSILVDFLDLPLFFHSTNQCLTHYTIY